MRPHQLSHSFFCCSITSVFSFLLYKVFDETVFYVPANTTRQISLRLQRFVRSSSKPATVYLGENKIFLFSLHLWIRIFMYIKEYR